MKILLLMLLGFIEQDSRIFLREGDSWSVKGRYSKAILFRETVAWETDEYSGDQWLAMVAVSHDNLVSILCF